MCLSRKCGVCAPLLHVEKCSLLKNMSSRLESKTVEDKRKTSPYFTRKLSKNGNLRMLMCFKILFFVFVKNKVHLKRMLCILK